MFGLAMIYYQLILLGVLVVATLVGYKVINKVPPTLHTPLMSGMNALSGVTVLGALTATAAGYFGSSVAGKVIVSILGIFAVALAMVNVVGGFAVTDRMLGMVAKKKAKGQETIYAVVLIVAAGLVAFIGCFGLLKKSALSETVFGSDVAYLVLSVLLSLGVLGGIAMMSKIAYSKIGNRISGICMFLAIILTVIYSQGRVYDGAGVYAAWPIYVGLLLGGIVGIILAKKVTMLQMPQMVALLNGLGGGASALVGALAMCGIGASLGYFEKVTSALALAVGMVTLLGSLVAAGKLHRILPQKPIVIKNHQVWQLSSLAVMFISMLLFILFATYDGSNAVVNNEIVGKVMMAVMFVLLTLSSVAFGLLFSLRVGGADMPITISLLNSFSGVAGAIAGLAVGDLLLVAVGGIVGASGLLLTQIMCKAMNRKLGAILSGKTTAAPAPAPAPQAAAPVVEEKKEVEKKVIINAAAKLQGAKKVIIVPGYGMALAQAQGIVKKLADKLVAQGTEVKYAIHPVAGRMPGHMNILLCEANVDYEDLFTMEDINGEFKDADAAIIIGANDVTNPAASSAVGTPIYGMPVLNVNDCKNIYVFNYDLKPGYAGVENPIYSREEGVTLYLGNASDTLSKFMVDMDAPLESVEEVASETEEIVEENPAAKLKDAKKVIIVPGYGMALAQAQATVKKLADKLVAQGTQVKYAIHPVAGRMPGHMNILLCEANVDYEDLFTMEDINGEFKDADAAIIVGANDVTNPAASTAVGTPIYGMPVLNVNDCKNIYVFNYDLKPGYAGVDNPIYSRKEGVTLYLGNAADTVAKFITDIDAPATIKKAVSAPVIEENPAAKLKDAKKVIIVPGYGMALAQAQGTVKKLADKLVAQGTQVKYAIHPVAGRMPGHMNILLCEANVDYEDLFTMEDINGEFKDADAAIIIGANDVTNPAASTAVGTPIYGMPVLNVNDCKTIFVFNYDLKPGYAGVDNPIYSRKEGVTLYLGNAADTLAKFITDIDAPAAVKKVEEEVAAPVVEENPAAKLIGAKKVIIVPGYGMALAQAQSTVKRLADKLVAQGTQVKYAIHPVAGRMPGHMNILLCEADVDYEDLFTMEDINGEFKDADAAFIIGANDVTNPAASTAVGTPIYGMPVLNVNDCKTIFVFNYDLKPGYAGVDNPIYSRKEGVTLYLGNAADTLAKFIGDMDKEASVETKPVVEAAPIEKVEEPVIEETQAKEPIAEEVPVEIEEKAEEIVEEPVIEAAPVEKVEEPIVEENKTEEDETEEDDADEAEEEDDEANDENAPAGSQFGGEFKYSKSFMARLILAPSDIKNYYSDLKNALLSYKKVSSRISWACDSINSGRAAVVKFNVKGKALYMYTALEAETLDAKYGAKKVETKKYAATPCLIKIKNPRKAKYALELVSKIAEQFNLVAGKESKENFAPETETIEALIEKGLVKENK